MNRKAFTMIELLTVIAIIAILAAIIFPVGARVKAAGLRSSDMSNLNEVRSALQLYKADQEVYPPQLLGYASLYFGGVNDGQVVPADKARGFVIPKPMTVQELTPNQNKVPFTAITTAVWPPQDLAAGAQVDLNGDGKIDGTDDAIASARQKFGPAQVVKRVIADSDETVDEALGRKETINTTAYPNTLTDTGGPNGLTTMNAYFYNVSGYDVGSVKIPGGVRTELRYAPFWSIFGLGGGDKTDDPRQLGYAEPPDNTVVTWNSYWRDYDASGAPTNLKNDMVLFLGGGAKTVASDYVNRHSWRQLP